ncbi:hypothetical protein FKN16_08470 [Vibrio sp. 11-4(1)]|nr:hypothetical protein [Vibrio sp. 11-4(1)]
MYFDFSTPWFPVPLFLFRLANSAQLVCEVGENFPFLGQINTLEFDVNYLLVIYARAVRL